MKAVTNEQFAEAILAAARPADPFVRTATYDPDGDCIEFLAKPDSFYGERIDDLVTVYRSNETDEVIGSLVKGVSRFCRRMLEQVPGFKIVVEDGRVRLEHVFLAQIFSSPTELDEMAVVTYRKLIEIAEKSGAEVEVCGPTA